MGMIAVKEAVTDSGLDINNIDSHRFGVIVSSIVFRFIEKELSDREKRGLIEYLLFILMTIST